MFKNRLVSLVLCFALVVACLPVFSISGSADNSGFCQVRIFYQFLNPGGTWSAETSAIITDNSFLNFGINGTTPIRITRFLVRNDSGSTMYFQFDINFGGVIPDPSGPNINNANPTYSSILFTVNGGVTAYSFDTTDKSPFVYQYASDSLGNPLMRSINSSSSRTFFGKVNSSGYITFNNPVVITWRKMDSPSNELYVFFRHLVIGIDDSSYLANLEHYLADISDYTNNINDILQKHDDFSQEFLDAGGAGAISDAAAFAPSAFGFIGALFGARTIISLSPGSYSYTNRFWTEWAHNIMNPNLVTRNNDDGYIDFYQQNLDEFWGGDE